jgi:hypothetical protein
MREYYKRLAKAALLRAPGPIDFWSGTFAALLAVAAHYSEWAQRLMNEWGWGVPIFAFIGVVAVRLFLAPYWLASKDAERIGKLEAIRADLTQKLHARENRQKTASALADALRKTDILAARQLASSEDLNVLHSDFQYHCAWMQAELGSLIRPPELAVVMAKVPPSAFIFSNSYGPQHDNNMNALEVISTRLQTLIGKYST